MSEPEDDKYLDDEKFSGEWLEIAGKKYKEGNPTIILAALHQCLLMRKSVPEWLREAFIKAYQSGTAFEIRTWDDVFGPPQPKGAHLAARKKQAELRLPVALRVALRDASAIDKGLFDKIGTELGVSGTTAADVYYKFGGRELQEIIEPLLPKSNSKKK
jgi:hypothetical protein